MSSIRRKNGMNMFYKNDKLNIGKEYTLTDLKKISMNSIHTLEIGGSKKGNKFVFESMGQQNGANKYCMLGTNRGRTYWHIHPTMNPFWPSLEDILRVCNHTTEYIITNYGYWIIQNNSGNLRFNEIKKHYDKFHDKLNIMFSTGKPFDVKQLALIIKTFKTNINKSGVNIIFNPWGALQPFEKEFKV